MIGVAKGAEHHREERMRATSFEGYYTFLLHQDLDFVMPYAMGRGDDPEAHGVGTDADRAAAIIERALPEAEWVPSIYDSVRGFVRAAAQLLVVCWPVACAIGYMTRRGT